MRGDGPSLSSSAGEFATFPPHARGWTVYGPIGASRQAVSPACAGMDLFVTADPASRSSFPRMRGDGP